MKSFLFSTVVLGISVFAGCGRHQAAVDSRLYFGLETYSGAILADTFQAFIDSVITPRFPDGLTRYDADGQWKNGKGIIVKEKSVVVEIIHAATPEAGRKIEEIRTIYKKRFSQESVLLVEDKPKVSF